MNLISSIRYKKRHIFYPEMHLLHIDIDKNSLIKNISNVKRVVENRGIGAVLKSNAYGHGLVEIGRFLDKYKDVNYLIVDSIVEAEMLRKNGINKDIIILGYIPFKALIKNVRKLKNIIIVLNSVKQAKIVSDNVNFNISVNINVDTGMHRNGIYLSEFNAIYEILIKNKNINVCGMMTHLADADNFNSKNTILQLKKWDKAVVMYRSFFGNDGIFHFSATSGIEYINKSYSNLVRLGIGMYGFDTTPSKILNVNPILSMFSKAVNVKHVKDNEKIGYNFTYKTNSNITLITLPAGYYEGIPRCLSNKGYVYFNNIKLPIIGRVSMNITNIDGTKIKNDINFDKDEFEIYSNNPKKENSIKNVAYICNTIPYEILCKLSPLIRRNII